MKIIVITILLGWFFIQSLAHARLPVLSCRLFNNGLPKADLQIELLGKSSTQDSQTLTTNSGKFRAQIIWNGYNESYPLNPELRIQSLDSKNNLALEAYKNFDLHRHLPRQSQNKILSENEDNLGLRTANDTVYLSCEYEERNVSK